MRLFVYGTLLDADMLPRLVGRTLPRAPATLWGRRRVALRGTRYPTLVPARGVIEGAVIRVDPVALARLAAYEGPRYRLSPLTVRCRGRAMRVRAWIGAAPTRRAWS